jgi:hypothetical protein
MEQSRYSVLATAFFLITLAALLIALACFSLVQGVMTHLEGNGTSAILLYMFSWVALGTGVALFFKGRKSVQTISV